MKKQGGKRFVLAGNSTFILLPSAFPQRHGGDGRFFRHRFAGIRAKVLAHGHHGGNCGENLPVASDFRLPGGTQGVLLKA